MLRLMIVFLGVLSIGCQAEMVVSNAIIRLLPPGVPNTSAYFSIENRSQQTEVLVGASTEIAEKAELHQHVMVNDMMRMQQLQEIKIEPGQSIQFKPGGLHVMLFGLNQTLQEQQQVSISLHTKSGNSIAFNATVARPSHHKHH